MSAVQRLSGCLAQTLRLSSRQRAASQQGAAFHLSATVEARRKHPASSSSDDESDDERNPNSAGAKAPRGGAGVADGQRSGSSARRQGSSTPADELYEQVEAGAAEYDVQTLISPALAAALEAAPEEAEEADKVFEKLHDAVEKLEKGEALPGDRPASHDDLRLIAEAIDLYFAAADEEDPEVDTLEEFDRELLMALGDTLKEVLVDPARNTVVNTAPAGRLPWEIIDVDEEVPMVNWGVDLTEGKAVDPWKNALLSDESKQLIYDMHATGTWGVLALAEHFRIRPQRVMAIIALKEQENEARHSGQKLHTELAEEMEWEMDAHEVIGSGEQHHVVLPSFPNYKELTEDDAERLAAMLERRLGKKFEDITADDMTPEVALELMAAAGMEKGAIEAELAGQEEQHLVAEFQRNLEYNLGKTGTSLSRSSRKTHPPKRPEGGWGLLVQPLGKEASGGALQAYVALPDGSRRELTEDERLQVERQRPRPRRKIL